MPNRMCRDCKTKPVQSPYYRCVDCLPKTHRGICEDCGADVIRKGGATGPLAKRCEPCRRHRKMVQTHESKRRALHDPEKLAKERERRRRQVANWRAKNPERAKELARITKQRAYADPERRARISRNARLARLRRKFDLSHEEAERFLLAADQGCGICGRAATGKELHADHCHDTGRLRGWLCGTCNSGLGQFYDNPSTLRAAAAYLEGR